MDGDRRHLKIHIKKKNAILAEGVRSLDFHPTEPWIVFSSISGTVTFWLYILRQAKMDLRVSNAPVRSVKFVDRKNWIVAGADNGHIYLYRYKIDGSRKFEVDFVKNFAAHRDKVRCLVVHLEDPIVLSSSDDNVIKQWKWGENENENWTCMQKFEGHCDVVMQVAFNPKDGRTFASASLDGTIKVWNLTSTQPNYTLDGHTKGVTSIDYIISGQKEFLVSGSNDETVKVWDCNTKDCVRTIQDHSSRVIGVFAQREIPLILSGCLDTNVRLWNAKYYSLEETLNFGLGEPWAFGQLRNSCYFAVCYEKGLAVMKFGKERPLAVMQKNKITWTRNFDVQTTNLTKLENIEIKDGESLPLDVTTLGTCIVYPNDFILSPDGQFAVVCQAEEQALYAISGWKFLLPFKCLKFVWSSNKEFAVMESTKRIVIYKDITLQSRQSLVTETPWRSIYGGKLMVVCMATCAFFFDWTTGDCLCDYPIEFVKNVFWADSGDLVAISTRVSFDILKYNSETRSFTCLHKIEEIITTAIWIRQMKTPKQVEDWFVYTDKFSMLFFVVRQEEKRVVESTSTQKTEKPKERGKVLLMFPSSKYILGHSTQQDQIYLFDREYSVVRYTLSAAQEGSQLEGYDALISRRREILRLRDQYLLR